MKKPRSKQLAVSLIILFCLSMGLLKTVLANTVKSKSLFFNNCINVFDSRATANTAGEEKQFFSPEENNLVELPFFDDFSNEYENWDTYSASGNLQWHISGDDGLEGSKCARIYSVVSPETNDDWLISPAFNTENVSEIKVSFYYWYYGESLTPEFYYSTNYTGDFENSDWTKIEYSFNIDPWDWRYTYFNLDVPADTFAFAFRYQSDIGDEDKIMIDDFSIEITETNDILKPWEAAAQMRKGINLGNTLEPPTEGGWNNPVADETYFDYYKDAGFDFVRVPLRWDEHMGETAPYQIDPAWMDRVEEVVDWGLLRDLFVIINAHHEEWIKENYDDLNMRARLDSLWSQIATRFKDKSDKLIFEILNEPTTQVKGLSIEENNEVIKRELSIIRETNPTRIVIFQGTGWSSSYDLFQVAIPDDDYLMGTYHSYSPYEFALLGQGTFDQEDYDNLQNEFINVKNWSDATNIPVLLGEFGSMKTCDYNSRMKQYNAYVIMAQDYNVIPCAWDDGGNFEILHRQDGTWDEVKDILIYSTSESPDNLNLEIYQDSIIKVTWVNHVADNDNIIIERRKSDEETYTPIAQVNKDVTEYDDVKPEGNVTYYYRIIAHYNDATDKYSYPQKYSFGLTTPELKISEIQGSGENSPFQDQQINTQGRITAVNQNGFYIQDTTGARSGIFVYAPELNGQFIQADRVKLTATVDEYNGKTELKDVTNIDSTDQSFPVYMTYIDGSQMGEDYEGVLVAIQGLKVAYQNKYQEYVTVSSGGDSVIVDNYLIQPEMEIGKTYNVQGIVDYLNGRFSLNPRAQAGIQVIETDISIQTTNATEIGTSSAVLNGEVVSDGGTTITQRGFYWSATNNSPNATDNIEIIDGTTGEFSFDLTGLTPETTYYYRAFATNSEGTAIGGTKQFTTVSDSDLMTLPFFDDFEEEDAQDITYWTTENIEGWNYWHVIAWGGNPGHCMRFEICDTDQDDWLITLPVECADAENLAVSFNYLFNGDRNPPQFFYTAQYNGDASQSEWTEIRYELGANENEWYHVNDTIFNNTSNRLYFGFRYQSTPNDAIFILLDNFRVKSFIPPAPFVNLGSTEHFEFYTNIQNQTNYWLEIDESLESSYKKYCGIWNYNGKSDFMDDGIKTKVYYLDKSEIAAVNDNTPETKSGFVDRESQSIFLSPLNTTEKQDYYGNLEDLAKNTFAILAKKFQLIRDRGGEDWMPSYFEEGFGLYEQGYRPIQDSILAYKSQHHKEYTHADLDGMNIFGGTNEKDMIVSYVEGQIICTLDYNGEAPYGSYVPIWNNFLTYFYDTTEVVQIKKYASNEHFDIYCSARDTMYIDSFFIWLERPRQFYIDSFHMQVNRKYNLVILYDEKTGMDITGYDDWNGGAGGLNISPENYPDYRGGGYRWLLAHEFGHVYNTLMAYDMPFGFYHEGMANFSGFMLYGIDWKENRTLIKPVLYYFLKNFNREPTLNEFIFNPYEKEGGNIDPYYFGLEFIRYLYETEGLLKIKEFFNNGMDFSVFSQTYNKIETEYIKRLKLYENLIPSDTLINLPFYETFNDFSNGWTKPSLLNPDNWQISDDGINGTNCARYYTYSDENEPVDCWLVSPALNAANLKQIQFSFDFSRFGEEIELEVLYTKKFEGYTDSTNWTSVKSIEMPTDWGWSNTGEITIQNPPDTIFIGLRQKSPGTQHLQLYIDNFSVKAVTSANIPTLETNNATSLTINSATLNGRVTSDGGDGIIQRGFYWSSTNASPGASDHVEIVEGTTGEFSFNLTGLTPETTYYFRAFAKNDEGTAVGEVKEFTTSEVIEKPSVVTYDASDIDIYSATLNGEVTDDGGDAVTQRGFYWMPTNAPGASQTIEIVEGTTGAFTFSQTGLEPETTYKFFAFASNSIGTTMAPIKQFTTLPEPEAPSVETNDATDTGIDNSTLKGKIIDEGSEEITQHGFYWSSINTSPDATDRIEIVTGTTSEFSKLLTGLQSETTYYFRAFAINKVGSGMGEVKNFTTQKALELPTVLTGDALEVASDGATLVGDVTADGGAEISQRGFYWSLEHSEPCQSDHIEIVEGTNGEFLFGLSGLNDETTCYFRAFATNSVGTALGEVKQFVTLSTGTANTEIPDFWLKAYPNPFNSETRLVYSLHQTGQVTISIYTTEGVKISIPLNKVQESGIHRETVSAENLSGGIYFCRIVSDKFARTIKLVVQ